MRQSYIEANIEELADIVYKSKLMSVTNTIAFVTEYFNCVSQEDLINFIHKYTDGINITI